MKISDENLYHGAALNQIAEHPRFTAINALKVKGQASRSAFKVNNDIAVYLKYAGKPTRTFKEYVFTFNTNNLNELNDIDEAGDRLHLALVCVKDRQICCIPHSLLTGMIRARCIDAGGPEPHYTLLAVLKPGAKFRVYMNASGRRKTILGKEKLIARSDFPDVLFR